MADPPRVWVLVDGRPGNASQARGVAEALGWPFKVQDIRYGPLAALPNALLGGSLLGLDRASRQALRTPGPDLVIGAGRRTAPVARWLKRRQPDAFLAQLMWPGSARGFDLVAVPEHDPPHAGPNVVRTLGAPHRLTAPLLAAAAAALAPRIAHLPRPRIVCLVGGTSRHAPFTPKDAAALARGAAGLARARGGSLLLTTNRRTGAACDEALPAALPADVPTWLHLFGQGGENPYFGLVGSADAVVVSGDSASMVTEACASGRPVFLFVPAAGTGAKLARLHARLAELGYLHPFGAPWPERLPRPLYPQATVAEAIRARLGARRRQLPEPMLARSAATH